MVRVLVGIHHFDRPNGATTYTAIVARHLGRLGHEVGIHTPDAGTMAELAREAGLPVGDDAGERPDAILAQDQMVAYALAERWPGVPQVFVAHGAYRDESMPPQIPGGAVATIVMNDRVEARARALAATGPVVRLRQPIDTELFRPRGRPHRTPRRAVLFGNNLRGQALDRAVGALEGAGLEVDHVGWHGHSEVHPERALGLADIVVGYGRCALEGMACGRPTYVFDHRGGDGWVTAASYRALEGNGFAGTATDESLDPDALAAALAGYDPELGQVGRALVERHHNAFHHANELVQLLRDVQAPAPIDAVAASELRRLSLRLWDAEWRAGVLSEEASDLHERLRVTQAELHQAMTNMSGEAATAAAARERVGALERELLALKTTARYRLAAALAAPLDRFRGRRRG